MLANELSDHGMYEQVRADKFERLRNLLKPMVDHQPLE